MAYSCLGHTNFVTCVSWCRVKDSEGRFLLASTSSDCTIRIWDTATGRDVHVLVGHTSVVCMVGWRPDLASIVVSICENNSIRVWDLSLRKCLCTMQATSKVIGFGFFRSDGEGYALISASTDGNLLLWNAQNGSLSATRKQPFQLSAVAISVDGKRIACGQTDGIIRILDTNKLSEAAKASDELFDNLDDLLIILTAKDVRHHRVASMAFGSDKRTLLVSYLINEDTSVSDDSFKQRTLSIYQWDLSTGLQLGQYKMDIIGRTDITILQLSPDGRKFVSGCANGLTSLWNYCKVPPLTGKSQSHGAPVTAVALQALPPPSVPCNSCRRPTSVRSRDNNKNNHDNEGRNVRMIAGYVCACKSWTLIASAAKDGSVHIWDSKEHTLLFSFQASSNSINSLVWEPVDDRNVNYSKGFNVQLASAAAQDSNITLWNLSLKYEFGKTVSERSNFLLKGHSATVRCVVYCPKRSGTMLLASGSEDNTIKVWDVEKRAVLYTLLDHHDCITSLAWSLDGTRLASGSGNSNIIL